MGLAGREGMAQGKRKRKGGGGSPTPNFPSASPERLIDFSHRLHDDCWSLRSFRQNFRVDFCWSTLYTMATHPSLPSSPSPPSFPPPFPLIDCHLRTKRNGRGRLCRSNGRRRRQFFPSLSLSLSLSCLEVILEIIG